MDIAIVGSGLAGLICAGRLQERGHRVVVYEAEEEVGGRMATQQTELGGFDHGAQYFTASSAAFKEQVSRWRKAKWVAPWNARMVALAEQGSEGSGMSETMVRKTQDRLVAVPGMQSLAQRLAEGLDVRCEQSVTRTERYDGKWLLGIRAETVAIDASAGPFDAVVLAVPADLAVPLLIAAPPMAERASRTRLEPCWSVMLGFAEPLGLGFDAAWVEMRRLAWIALDASKPERRPGEHWVLHAPRKWSAEHLDDDPERVKEKLLKAFHQATGTGVQPVYAATHLWRHAQARQPVGDDCLWDRTLRIGACGDWFAAGLEGSGRVENAFLSGAALASEVDQTLAAS